MNIPIPYLSCLKLFHTTLCNSQNTRAEWVVLSRQQFLQPFSCLCCLSEASVGYHFIGYGVPQNGIGNGLLQPNSKDTV